LNRLISSSFGSSSRLPGACAHEDVRALNDSGEAPCGEFDVVPEPEATGWAR